MPFDTEGRPPPGDHTAAGGPPSITFRSDWSSGAAFGCRATTIRPTATRVISSASHASGHCGFAQPRGLTRCSFRVNSALSPRLGRLLLWTEAVAQTLNEAVRSFLRVGSEIGHRIHHARCVRPDVVTPTRSRGRLRDRAAPFRRRLYATASTRRGSPAHLPSGSSFPHKAVAWVLTPGAPPISG
jgi:hypothetical protein